MTLQIPECRPDILRARIEEAEAENKRLRDAIGAHRDRKQAPLTTDSIDSSDEMLWSLLDRAEHDNQTERTTSDLDGSMDEHTAAQIVARHVIESSVNDRYDLMWEFYPDLEEYDWNAVCDEVENTLRRTVRVPADQFDEAYETLTSRTLAGTSSSQTLPHDIPTAEQEASPLHDQMVEYEEAIRRIYRRCHYGGAGSPSEGLVAEMDRAYQMVQTNRAR